MNRASVATLSLLLSHSLGASAQWNLSEDFDTRSNPAASSPWSYGYRASITGSFVLLDDAHALSLGVREGWKRAGFDTFPGVYPQVIKNLTASSVTLGSLEWEPYEVGFHPGENGLTSGARWIAPSDTDYEYNVSFRSMEGGVQSVYVLINNSVVESRTLSGGGTTFSGQYSATSGDSFEFAVEYAGSINSDFVGIDATIQPIPEPASGMAVLGLGTLALGRRRRHA